MWKWGEKVAFSCLQRVNKTQLFHPISRNLGPTFKSIPARRGRHALSPEGGTLAAPVLVYCSLTTGCPKVTVMVWTANIFFTCHCMRKSTKKLKIARSLTCLFDMGRIIHWKVPLGNEWVSGYPSCVVKKGKWHQASGRGTCIIFSCPCDSHFCTFQISVRLFQTKN